jgi:hypothetical protein
LLIFCLLLLLLLLQSLDEQGAALFSFFNDNSVVSKLKDIPNRVLISELGVGVGVGVQHQDQVLGRKDIRNITRMSGEVCVEKGAWG